MGVTANKDVGKTTRRGFGEHTERETLVDLEGAARRRARADGGSDASFLEIEHVNEAGTPTLLTGPWRAVEIWTANRIYGLDSAMVCREVLDRSIGKPDLNHKTLGAVLIGGQRRGRNGGIEEVSHPFPRPAARGVHARDGQTPELLGDVDGDAGAHPPASRARQDGDHPAELGRPHRPNRLRSERHKAVRLDACAGFRLELLFESDNRPDHRLPSRGGDGDSHGARAATDGPVDVFERTSRAARSSASARSPRR